eukprot:gnl/Trimastix_PCT/3080.p1 GENE.gnl/Trimastix_PCT/3080~~gnl/Trimastix_PCT/3080.p1  ORF type:complete len:327 (+),score=84.34 gnl/Trimastix_PCT/3080:306-1286(+)
MEQLLQGCEFSRMPRKELQALCKKFGIRANTKNADMIKALEELKQSTQTEHAMPPAALESPPSPAPVVAPELPKKSTSTVSRSLLDICDDGLISVFHCLELTQLATLRSVCRRFRTIIGSPAMGPAAQTMVILGRALGDAQLSALVVQAAKTVMPDNPDWEERRVQAHRKYSKKHHSRALWDLLQRCWIVNEEKSSNKGSGISKGLATIGIKRANREPLYMILDRFWFDDGAREKISFAATPEPKTKSEHQWLWNSDSGLQNETLHAQLPEMVQAPDIPEGCLLYALVSFSKIGFSEDSFTEDWYYEDEEEGGECEWEFDVERFRP